jgi:predicted nucleotidyltransferase
VPYWCSDVVLPNAEIPKAYKVPLEDVQVDFVILEESLCLQAEIKRLDPGEKLKEWRKVDFSGKFIVPIFPPRAG